MRDGRIHDPGNAIDLGEPLTSRHTASPQLWPRGGSYLEYLSMDRLRFLSLPSRTVMRRHGHLHPYAALVVNGHYEEAGDSGRYRVTVGDVLIHAPFSAHCDRIPAGRNCVLDIPIPQHAAHLGSIGRVHDVDAIVRIAAKDPAEVVDALLEQLIVIDSRIMDLPDMLACALRRTASPRIADWAREHGIARETISRQFSSLYEVTPARFRVESRARQAWNMISSQPDSSLAEIAATCGFSDQAHLTRDVATLTGATPGSWRARNRDRSHLFKTIANSSSDT